MESLADHVFIGQGNMIVCMQQLVLEFRRKLLHAGLSIFSTAAQNCVYRRAPGGPRKLRGERRPQQGATGPRKAPGGPRKGPRRAQRGPSRAQKGLAPHFSGARRCCWKHAYHWFVLPACMPSRMTLKLQAMTAITGISVHLPAHPRLRKVCFLSTMIKRRVRLHT